MQTGSGITALQRFNQTSPKIQPQYSVFRCWCAAETSPLPLGASQSERRAKTFLFKATDKPTDISWYRCCGMVVVVVVVVVVVATEKDISRYPCCGMVVGPGEGKGCTSTHPCCGAAQVDSNNINEIWTRQRRGAHRDRARGARRFAESVDNPGAALHCRW